MLALLVSVGACGDDGGTSQPPRPDSNPVTPPGKTCGSPIAAVDTSAPDHVVSDCTRAGLAAAAAQGGTITFACGDAATVIAIDQPIMLRTDVATTIDGGNKITLDGGDASQILIFDHGDYRKNDTVLTLQHIAFAHGRAKGTKMYAPSSDPDCSQGFYNDTGGGGALQMRDGVLHVIDATFAANRAASLGPDVGGGAITLLGCKGAIIANSAFQNNRGSNGGAIDSLNSELEVYDSVFDGNVAEGHGANGDDASKCDVVADNGQHQTGSGGNGGAIVIDGGDDLVHTFCGVTFTSNQGGDGALGGALFRTPDGPKRQSVIDRCVFRANKGASAGAAYFHNSDLRIVASTFDGNIATGGAGALQADGTTFDFLNDTFANNSAQLGLGGAIDLFGGGGTIAFSTFSANHADGGDPYFGAHIGGNPTLTLTSNIFAHGTAKNPGAPMQCHVTGTGDGNIQWPRGHDVGGGDDQPCTPTAVFADPMLGELGDHGGASPTMIPAAAAMGAGVSCPPTDQRGMPRPATACTSGSVEP